MTEVDLQHPAHSVPKHTLLQSILLHLGPGVLGGAAYYALAPLVRSRGYPTLMALILAGVFVLVPVELGLLYAGSRQEGSISPFGAVRYRRPLPLPKYLLWVPVIFLGSAALMTLLTPAADGLQVLFEWIPESFRVGMGLTGDFSRQALIITYSAAFLFVVVIVPVVEEMYFRGYLLPRLPVDRRWSPLVHSGLFALYHTWTPWMVVSRTIGVLPLIYVVRWKKNLTVGVIAHCLLNSIDIVVGVAFILQMG